uniref:DNA primase large subunit C-terminal domain-containing protein n=1 Tax=Arcella intermedia TaxID=1963864 RepID=A0A6B2L438_9EUKA
MLDVPLEIFESWAIDRLKVLREIESSKIRQKEEYERRLDEFIKKYLPLDTHTSDPYKNEEDIKKDVISHWILRLAYCRPEYRDWFITQERELLKLRIQNLDRRQFSDFLHSNNLSFSDIDYISLPEDLRRHLNELDKGQSEYYQVPFERALSLLSSRSVVVRDGLAYVARPKLKSVVLCDFRERLDNALVKIFNESPNWNTDERISHLIEFLPTQYLGKEYVSKQKEGEIDISQLDSLSDSSMPICMKNIHKALRRDHHLKHGGRMQYGLFLKGLGLSLEQSLQFWSSEFRLKGLDFDADYAYNIKHNYGTVGKRTSYSPYSCSKIISSKPKGGDTCGCPFVHSTKAQLKTMLREKGIEEQKIQEIVSINNPNECCAMVFFHCHPGKNVDAMTHPNKYFDKSVKYYEEKKNFMDKPPPPPVPSAKIQQVVVYNTKENK